MAKHHEKTPADLLTQNKRWADARISEDPGYFSRLSGLQTPRFLWIGCADSRVPANVITGLDPGEVFVHRNVANMIYPADLNCMSVLQFAVEALKVQHIIVCGHYGCGGVRAAVDGNQHGLIDHWLEPIRDLNRRHKDVLRSLPSDDARQDCLCELNVREQTRTVINSPIIQRAWDRGQKLSIHGWIYGLANGLLKDLECGKTGQ